MKLYKTSTEMGQKSTAEGLGLVELWASLQAPKTVPPAKAKRN